MAKKRKMVRRQREALPPVPLRRTCGCMQVYNRMLEQYPQFRAAQIALELDTSRRRPDTRIQFALATTDPNGNATQGITRTNTTKTSFGSDDLVKSVASGGADPWPSDKYLNIWACTRGWIIGLCQFPGPPSTDGNHFKNCNSGQRVQPPIHSISVGPLLTRLGIG